MEKFHDRKIVEIHEGASGFVGAGIVLVTRCGRCTEPRASWRAVQRVLPVDVSTRDSHMMPRYLAVHP